MSLSSDKVMEKVNSLLENQSKKESEEVKSPANDETKPEEVKDPESTTAVEEPVKEEPKEQKEPSSQAEPEQKEPAKPAEPETGSDKKDLNNKDPEHSPTKQEKIDFAFKREKAKRKAAEARYAKAAKELEELKKQKVEYNADNPSEYINHQVDLKTLERQKDEIYDELSSSMSAEYEEINNRRISACFPDEGSQAKFRQVIDTEGPKLLKTLDEFDPDQAVLAYLDDSDLSPILTSVLIQKPQYLEEVLSKRSKYGKYLAMQELENRIRLAQKQLSEEKKKPDETQQPSPQKKPLPIVGSQTKSENTEKSQVAFDPNAFLRKLNEGSKRYHSNGRNLSK